ncbi:MarR family winged helix-turn-helix transcriptional regulator [Longispora albida]|uniref:MarR family winged helix-turn-helix transcriptional regulator n=1 Tax=Longispora albida TaxID=203523 RepID=UPI00039CBDDC|nr:MarR family transcriptional regulator [Longispora albida]
MTMPAAERLGLEIKRAEQELMSAKQAALREAGLTVGQYAALFALAEQPGISGAALARACLVTPQNMAAVLKVLEGRGLVERAAHSLHQHVLETRLTPQGTRLLGLADRRAVEIERRLAAAFTAQEAAQLRDLLNRASAAIRGEPPQAG